MNTRQTGIGLALAAAGSLAVLWLTNIPLGIPGEWAWTRIPIAAGEWIVLLLGCLSTAVVGGLYIGLAALGAVRLEAATRGETAAWLGALCAAGFAWLWAVQESPAATEYEMAKSGWVLYYPAHEGYFDQARYLMRDVPSYLAGYQERMAHGDVLHLGTHPPGLMLFHRACIKLCSASPTLCDLLLRTQPASFRAALDVTERTERAGPRAITPADRAALWLAALITQAVAAAAILPIYLLARRTNSRTTSWWTAALWPLLPALAIFLPKSDALFPFFGAIFLWLWLEGFRRGSLGICALAGASFWLAMFLSLAILPIALAAGLLTLWEAVLCIPQERTALRCRDWVARLGAAAIGWCLPVVLLWLIGRINLLSVWQWNYRNHAAFYAHYARTYWKWLLVNPIEFGFAVGAPTIAAAAIGFRSVLAAGWRRRAMGPYWCLTATWLVLWLSGKNMGEAARLWLVVMPWPVLLAAGFFAPRTDTASGGRSIPTRAAVVLLVIQMAVSFGTVTRVTGFDFPNLPAGQNVSMREPLPSGRLPSVPADSIQAFRR
jgi:hypothetical protein